MISRNIFRMCLSKLHCIIRIKGKKSLTFGSSKRKARTTKHVGDMPALLLAPYRIYAPAVFVLGLLTIAILYMIAG